MYSTISFDMLDHSGGRAPPKFGLSCRYRSEILTVLDHDDGSVPVMLFDDSSIEMIEAPLHVTPYQGILQLVEPHPSLWVHLSGLELL